MSMTFFFSKVRERPATRQHPCANNNGYGFQNEQIANRCFFSVINRHNVCEQKKKKLFGEWKTWPTWFDEFFLREIGRKKKRKKLFRWESPLVPTTQFGTKNTISLLDSTKNLNELRKNKTIEKKKKKRNTNTLSLYRMKKCTNLKMSKRQQTACSSSTGPKKYWQPVSVNELLVCSTVLPYTSTACTTKIKESKQPQDVRIWRLWTRTAQIAFPNANCTQISSDASYLLCVAM